MPLSLQVRAVAAKRRFHNLSYLSQVNARLQCAFAGIVLVDRAFDTKKTPLQAYGKRAFKSMSFGKRYDPDDSVEVSCVVRGK